MYLIRVSAICWFKGLSLPAAPPGVPEEAVEAAVEDGGGVEFCVSLSLWLFFRAGFGGASEELEGAGLGESWRQFGDAPLGVRGIWAPRELVDMSDSSPLSSVTTLRVAEAGAGVGLEFRCTGMGLKALPSEERKVLLFPESLVVVMVGMGAGLGMGVAFPSLARRISVPRGRCGSRICCSGGGSSVLAVLERARLIWLILGRGGICGLLDTAFFTSLASFTPLANTLSVDFDLGFCSSLGLGLSSGLLLRGSATGGRVGVEGLLSSESLLRRCSNFFIRLCMPFLTCFGLEACASISESEVVGLAGLFS